MRGDTAARHDDRVLGAIHHITDWVRDGWADIDVDLLAREANTAPHYFRRIFRDATGDPVLRFVRRLRLEVAAYRVVFSTQPIIDVAIAAGYGSAAAFSRAFKDQYGSCPADARALRPMASWPTDGPCCQGVRADDRGRQTLAFFRCFGRLTTADATWDRLARWSGRSGRDFNDAQRVIICHDDPERYLGEPIRFDAGILVTEAVSPLNGVGLQVVPAGRSLLTRHTGPLEFTIFSYMHLAVVAAMTGLCQPGTILPFSASYRYCPDDGGLRTTADVGFTLPVGE